MTTVPQVELLRSLVSYLRASGLPQSPMVRTAIVAITRRDEIADRTIITLVPGVPKSERTTRGAVHVNDIVDVAIQRAVPAAADSKSEVVDLDWACVQAMLALQRAVMLALHAFPGVLAVEGLNAGAPEHAKQGIWTGVFRVTFSGETTPC